MNTLLLPSRRSSRKISLTPLIDVVFILLLFFMLSSSFHNWRFIDWPVNTSGHSAHAEPTTESIFILLDKSGGITQWPQQKSWPNVNDLTHLNYQQISQGKDTSLLLIPENKTPLQVMVNAVEHFRSMGVSVELTAPVSSHDASN